MGLHRAGFEVVGFDLAPQPRYPFEFHQRDAFGMDLGGFDAIWASPPCQAYTPLRARYPDKVYPDLIPATRAMLTDSDLPWIIENVMPAPIARDVVLCGTMFDLRVYRHRKFESPFLFMCVVPEHPKHKHRTGSGHGQTQRKAHYLAGNFVTVTGNVGSYAGEAMGIDWMLGRELSQAIPPAYSEYLGKQLMAVLS
jgi:DNA (cytosine-5)-methyltransferase 1